MRKLFMLVTMLLVPTLASAWTMAVKVTNTTAGINAGNGTTLTVGAGAPVSWPVGAKYLYPTNAQSVTVKVANSANATVSLAGAALQAPVVDGTDAIYTIPSNATKTIQTLSVAYATAATAQKRDISLTQTPNGLTSLSIGSSSTTTGYTGVPVGTLVTVKAQPNTGSTLAGITVNGTPLVGTTFTVLDSVSAYSVVTTYAKTAVISATLSLPTSGQIGTPVTASVAVSGIDAPTYAWTVNGIAAGAADSCSVIPVAGVNIVQVIVSKAGSVPVTKVSTIQGVDLTAAANYTCTSCHSGSTPQVVAAYNGSAHVTNSVSCQNCHSNAAHTTTVQSSTCESCHTGTLSTATHPVALTATKCLSCHDGHNPAEGIANLGPAPAHPAVTLYTFEEIGMQMAGGAKVPVQVDASGKGMPYSPKQTCGTAGCHIKNGVDYTYDKISDHAFHSGQGRSEYVDSTTGKFDATKNKPWLQSTAMVGKW